MQGFFKSVYLAVLMVWIGEIVFFSFVVLPAVFRMFAPEEAGRAVGVVFPIYYRVGYVCGLLSVISAAWLWRSAAARGLWSANLLVLTAMLAATLYAGIVVQPRAAALRPQLHVAVAAADVKPEFDRLHRLAVTLNGAVLVGGIVVTVFTALRLRP